MKKFLFCLLTLGLFNVAFAQHDHALTNAKIAHDASHRIGRLVDTGKIDEIFIKNMSSLEVKELPHNQHTDPAFSVLASSGSGSQTLLTFDMKGKFLSNKVLSLSSAEETPWDVYASELLETALHHVMEATIPNLDIAAFNKGLSKAELKQQKTEEGLVQAIVIMTSESTTKSLQVVLSPAAEILSTTIVE